MPVLNLPDCGLLSHGDVYLMGVDDSVYVSAEKFTSTGVDGEQLTGLLFVQHVPDGAAAAAVSHLGRGSAMRVYATYDTWNEENKWHVLNYQGFRFYSLGA